MRTEAFVRFDWCSVRMINWCDHCLFYSIIAYSSLNLLYLNSTRCLTLDRERFYYTPCAASHVLLRRLFIFVKHKALVALIDRASLINRMPHSNDETTYALIIQYLHIPRPQYAFQVDYGVKLGALLCRIR